METSLFSSSSCSAAVEDDQQQQQPPAAADQQTTLAPDFATTADQQHQHPPLTTAQALISGLQPAVSSAVDAADHHHINQLTLPPHQLALSSSPATITSSSLIMAPDFGADQSAEQHQQRQVEDMAATMANGNCSAAIGNEMAAQNR
ncbi:hypothetical protein niasHS_001995 [Heterodera schachtii]|uniref:Uncharacterized protein n=1 Tax=Heterodera schachtii TaxID=97005 RepID=A0ABD2K5K5_HETSC